MRLKKGERAPCPNMDREDRTSLKNFFWCFQTFLTTKRVNRGRNVVEGLMWDDLADWQ